eukprot:4865805-Amphidinium_carterae.1
MGCISVTKLAGCAGSRAVLQLSGAVHIVAHLRSEFHWACLELTSEVFQLNFAAVAPQIVLPTTRQETLQACLLQPGPKGRRQDALQFQSHVQRQGQATRCLTESLAHVQSRE